MFPQPSRSSGPLPLFYPVLSPKTDVSIQDHHGLWSTQSQLSQHAPQPCAESQSPWSLGTKPMTTKGPHQRKWLLLRRELLSTYAAGPQPLSHCKCTGRPSLAHDPLCNLEKGVSSGRTQSLARKQGFDSCTCGPKQRGLSPQLLRSFFLNSSLPNSKAEEWANAKEEATSVKDTICQFIKMLKAFYPCLGLQGPLPV